MHALLEFIKLSIELSGAHFVWVDRLVGLKI